MKISPGEEMIAEAREFAQAVMREQDVEDCPCGTERCREAYRELRAALAISEEANERFLARLRMVGTLMRDVSKQALREVRSEDLDDE